MTDNYDRFYANRDWWTKKRDKYEDKYGIIYCARASIWPGSNPERSIHLFSAPLFKQGERFYMFATEASREAFVCQCPTAEACQDPLPRLSVPEIPSCVKEACVTTYGKMDATVGEKCSNRTEIFTSPCCYVDHDEEVTQCSNCGAPLKCYEEKIPEYVCEIVEPEDDD